MPPLKRTIQKNYFSEGIPNLGESLDLFGRDASPETQERLG
jgi:hypothetical protein